MVFGKKQKKSACGGQGIVEYILLIAIIVAFLIIFLGKGGVFQNSYDNVIQTQGQDMADMANAIFF